MPGAPSSVLAPILIDLLAQEVVVVLSLSAPAIPPGLNEQLVELDFTR